MQSQRSSQKRAGKKIHFFELQNLFFFFSFFFYAKPKEQPNKSRKENTFFRIAKLCFFSFFFYAKPKEQPKKSRKENTFFQIAQLGFFHFSSSFCWRFLLHRCINFSPFFFKLSDLDCSEIAI